MKYRILILMHMDLVPPVDIKKSEIDRDNALWITEYDVSTTLKKMGHDIKELGVYSDLKVIREAIDELKPHIVYNLLEEFDGEVVYDQNVVSYLELLKVPYTGCNPRGLMLARDKALAKKILTYHRIKTPKFHVFPKNRNVLLPKKINYPMIVKCLFEEASLGISQASVVHNEEKLLERLSFIHQNIKTDAIIEEFIEGREFYVGVLGNYRLKTLPVWELLFENADNPGKEIYSRNAKWNMKYRNRKGIKTQKAKITPEVEERILDVCKKTYKTLNLNGYARIDLRVSSNGNIYVIEANPNPNIGLDDEFALSAKNEKIKYEELLKKIISLGLSWSTVDQ